MTRLIGVQRNGMGQRTDHRAGPAVPPAGHTSTGMENRQASSTEESRQTKEAYGGSLHGCGGRI